MRNALSLLLLAAGSYSALAQGYAFEMRLIADGMPGSPGGPTAATTFNAGTYYFTPTRIGFWLQARVSQTSGQNWGITRASSPAGGAAFIVVGDSTGTSGLSRGVVNTGGTVYGRGLGYRNGGISSGNTGNAAGSLPFPGNGGNENGGLDNGGGGGPLMTRIYGFDSYAGATRTDTDFDTDGDVDDDGDGIPEQPWRVNGGSGTSNVNGVPHLSDGTFAPWANLYRFWIDIGDTGTYRTITLSAAALLNGSIQASPTSPGGASFAMQLGPGQTLQTNFDIPVGPTPGAAGVLTLGAVAAARRRRSACSHVAVPSR